MTDFSQGEPPGFWHLFWRNGGIIPVILVFVTIVVTVFAFWDLRTALALDRRGVETVAEVVDRERRVERTDNRTRTRYFVTLRYEVSGTVLQDRQTVSRTFYEDHPEGSPQTVRYLPDQPDVVEFWVGRTASQGRSLQIAALVIGLVTLAFGWITGRRTVAMLRARRFGPHEVGTVVEIVERRTKRATVHALVWRDAQGERGMSDNTPTKKRYANYPPGTRIDLFRDAKGRAWWSGDVGDREEHARR